MKQLKTTYLLLIAILIYSCSKKNIEADILIQNGTVYNGIDKTSANKSIAIKNDKIVFIGDKNTVSINAKKTIDATGLIVSPGFIDPHTHADRDLKNPKSSHNKPFLFQGITTVVTGLQSRGQRDRTPGKLGRSQLGHDFSQLPRETGISRRMSLR